MGMTFASRTSHSDFGFVCELNGAQRECDQLFGAWLFCDKYGISPYSRQSRPPGHQATA